MATSRIDRRTFLVGAAAGVAALGAPVRSLAAPPRDRVDLEFWNPSGDTHILLDIVTTFNNTVGNKNNIDMHNRIVDDSNSYIKYTTAMTSSNSPDAIMTYAYDQVPSWAANGFIQPMDKFAQQVGIKQGDY